MECQQCRRRAVGFVWLPLASGQVRVVLCGSCEDRQRAIRGDRDWLPVPASGPRLPAVRSREGGSADPRRDAECAKKANLAKGALVMAGSTIDLTNLRCPDCGTTFLDFRRTGRLGCPHDYEVFRLGLLPLLDRVQRAQHHRGKHPRQQATDPQGHRDLRTLRRRLREAVDAEDYAQAAEIRDQIRARESGHGSQ